jgi:hypothetical protein
MFSDRVLYWNIIVIIIHGLSSIEFILGSFKTSSFIINSSGLSF